MPGRKKKRPVWSCEKVRLGMQVPLPTSLRIARRFGKPGRFATPDDILAALEESVRDVPLSPDDELEIARMRADAMKSRIAARGAKGGVG